MGNTAGRLPFRCPVPPFFFFILCVLPHFFYIKDITTTEPLPQLVGIYSISTLLFFFWISLIPWEYKRFLHLKLIYIFLSKHFNRHTHIYKMEHFAGCDPFLIFSVLVLLHICLTSAFLWRLSCGFVGLQSHITHFVTVWPEYEFEANTIVVSES